MRKRIVVAVVISLLVISTGVLAAFSVRAVATIKEHDSQMNALTDTITSLKQDMANMRTLTGGLSDEQDISIAGVIKLVEPAVVRIDVSGTGFVRVGSGFILEKNGYVITNNHVVEGSTGVQVTLSSGDSYAATISDTDAGRDLALIKMVSTRLDFPVIELGSASDAQVGDTLLMGGFPLGLELSGPATFTQGIVSAVREIGGLSFIQTDASINSGSSGGPAIDIQGTLVGICVAAVTNADATVQGMGLVIPVADILTFVNSGRVACSSCHS